MRSAKSSLVVLGILAAVACTSTVSQPSVPSSTGGGSPTDTPADGSPASGTIVFNRGIPGAANPAEGEEGPPGIAVYRLDLGTGSEEKIRDVWDFMTLSPDGSHFLGAKPIPDGRIGTEIFDVDGSHHVLLPIPDPTLQLGVGQWSRDGKWIVSGGWDDTDPSRGGLYRFRSADGGGLVRLTHPASPPNDYLAPLACSPDSSRILFIREKEPFDHSGPMNVLMRKNGSGVVRLNPPGTSSWLEAQSWSPDGRQVAFVASRDGQYGNAVFVVNLDGTHARRITPWSVTLKVEWSPDRQ